jgi:aldehyde:ferredoxin oxidoreductase
MHFHDCAVLCQFYPYEYGHLAAAMSGVTGVTYRVADILDVGARAQTLSRLYNAREGFTAADDRMPERVLRAFADGPLTGVGIDKQAFAWARRRYCELMDWDPETELPGPECLSRLALDDLLKDAVAWSAPAE